MSDLRFELNEQTMPIVKQIGAHMPGGFFIYRAQAPEELIYANQALIDIFGCDDLEDFKRLTGFTFRGMVHPEDYDATAASISSQIAESDDQMDYVEYRRMPGMDGIETLARLGELYPEKRARTPVICLTASAVTGVREKMLAAGFTDYVTKPVDIEKMEAVLIQYLPKEKVTLTEDEPQEDPLALLPREVFDVPDLDPAAGIAFCGDAEAYMAALRSFADSIETRAGQIGQCLDSADIAGYTLRVHSLKSTARAVGALEVSDRARALEESGSLGDAEALRRDTPLLLEAYRSLKGPLEALFRKLEDESEKPPLSEAEFDDALAAVRELCALYDDAGIQGILDELKGRAVPDSRKELYRELCEAAGCVDWERLASLTGAQ